ncbi:copper resistance protein B [Sphingosinicella microcystinivorans]|uniref:Copper resistance protein B n=2 Tax=Sphingosinicella microcystinivorans TaxID=335406 RepID=A0ABX9T052_SPHMI|nr:copper resistance protein B [Sphingosinicella microcystinivorans]RKS90714.1 copper resistance protein B [Sphingosinicella microcystinivorans]
MKRLIALLLIGTAGPAFAQDHSQHQMPADDPHAGHAMPAPTDDPHAGHTMPAPTDPHAGHVMPQADPHAGHGATPSGPSISKGPPPAAAAGGPTYAADAVFGADTMAAARAALYKETGGMTVSKTIVDRLEAGFGQGEETYLWDVQGWIGRDIDKFWWKTEGEGAFGGPLESAEVQALWSHAIGPFFDLQAGVRYDIRPEPDRAHAVIGIQGLAPYKFEVDAAAFISTKGDVTARIEAEYDQRLTQKLILQPRIEVELSAQDIPEYGIGAGLSAIEAGARLGYEFVPQFRPYVGVEWHRKIGDTADFARAAGEDVDAVRGLVGVRFWF